MDEQQNRAYGGEARELMFMTGGYRKLSQGIGDSKDEIQSVALADGSECSVNHYLLLDSFKTMSDRTTLGLAAVLSIGSLVILFSQAAGIIK